MIPYARHDISQADIDSVVEVLRSDWLTQGPLIEKFEKTVADYTSASNAIAVNSATSALHLACLALNVGPGDRVWTTPNTFVATANCALYCGASVDFVDIDPVTKNMGIHHLVEKLKSAKDMNMLPKVVIPVHFAGQPCDMLAIKELSDYYGFKIIEDASHAIGSWYIDDKKSINRIKVGSCAHSDISIFSFHPVKIITTGEGGMALTNSPLLAARIRSLSAHGINKDPKKMLFDSHGCWYYEMQELGHNYRMTDFQAALGLSQMDRLDEFIDRRNELAQNYHKLLGHLPLLLPQLAEKTFSSWHLYVVEINLLESKKKHQQIFEALRAAGIGVGLHYMPVHMQPYYQNLGFRIGDFPAAENYYSRAISLPLYPALSEAQQQFIAKELEKSIL